MKLHSAGLAALSLAIALGLSACGGDKQAAQQPAADSAAAPAAAGHPGQADRNLLDPEPEVLSGVARRSPAGTGASGSSLPRRPQRALDLRVRRLSVCGPGWVESSLLD